VATSASTAFPGLKRIGPYVLVKKLGEGGFAPVWLAKEMFGDTELRPAAVKVFQLDRLSGRRASASDSASPSRLSQVIEEARTLCRIEHPNVVRFYSMINDPDQGIIALAMEYIAGESVDAAIERRGRLDVAQTFDIGISVASALASVHRSGLVHRDVKPANVVDAAGVYKLIDFGIAAAATGQSRPESGQIVIDDLPISLGGTEMSQLPEQFSRSGYGEFPAGTIGYMDPEAVSSGSRAVPASDLYSLGAMLFFGLTGKLPAAAEGWDGLKGDILDGRRPAPSIGQLVPSVPRALAALIDRLLAPRRADRPKSADWVARELERLRSEARHQPRQVPSEDVGPFRSLERYEQGDHDVYFGRTVEVAGALELLRSRGFAAVVGPSGSGKSSLARAGIVPAVQSGALGHWPPAWDVFVTSPGVDPKAALTSALTTLVPNAASLTPDELIFHLGEHVQATGRGVFLLVDQLEELATLAAGESQTWAVELLVRLGEQTLPGVRTLATARQDLLDALLRINHLGRTLGRGALLVVTPLTEAGWLEVVDQSLQVYGYSLEDETLRATLREQLRGTANAMPLVQFALGQLWGLRDRDRKVITNAALKQIGGIAGALERHAEAQLTELREASEEAVETARRILLELTTAQGTRATLAEAELLRRVPMRLTAAVLERLERARLFVREHDGVTLAHEALITHWRRLQRWVADVRETRELVEDLERDALRWNATPEEIPLLPKPRLRNLQAIMRSGEHAISEYGMAYVKASWREANRARRNLVMAGAGVLLILGLILAVYLKAVDTQNQVIETQKQLALSEKMGALQTSIDGVEGKLKKVDDAVALGDLSTARSEISSLKKDVQEIHVAFDGVAGQLPVNVALKAAAASRARAASLPSSASRADPGGPIIPTLNVVAGDTTSADPASPPPVPAPQAEAPPPAPSSVAAAAPTAPKWPAPGECQSAFAPLVTAVPRSCLSGQFSEPLVLTASLGLEPDGKVSAVNPKSASWARLSGANQKCIESEIKRRFQFRPTPPPGISCDPIELRYEP
jgi:serine/threonine protein kinase